MKKMENDALLTADKEHSIFTGAPSFSRANRMTRALWMLVWGILGSWTPPPLHRWRILLLKLFGAQIDWSCRIYGSVRIWYPPHLEMAPFSVMGPGVTCYNQGEISLGRYVVVSQGAHLCTGTHDISDPAFQLYTRPIKIGPNAWICADAFVAPGVDVGEGAILGARSVAFRDMEPWGIYRGNPAEKIKTRPRFSRD